VVNLILTKGKRVPSILLQSNILSGICSKSQTFGLLLGRGISGKEEGPCCFQNTAVGDKAEVSLSCSDNHSSSCNNFILNDCKPLKTM
jgi:hypothetical protein